MRKHAISVTEAARNFADCVNRAYYQNVTYVLLRNGSPVAQLVPEREKVCTGRDLAGVLANTRLSEEEAMSWHKDLASARETLLSPVNKWR
jgi:antitoxin (DNA-binding transcriptional repressor) of toxin-antitoxin stability system